MAHQPNPNFPKGVSLAGHNAGLEVFARHTFSFLWLCDLYHMGFDATKPVIVVSDKGGLKPVSSYSETS